MPPSSPIIERARPLLGTRVSIRVEGLVPPKAHAAIDEAFAEIAAVHALMSFHEPDSDVSRLNREAHCRAITIDRRSFAVILRALALARCSGGAFDISIAPALVERGSLPSPIKAPHPDPNANWQDIIAEQGTVRFRRPLWVDLGGIAKGYAVDRAIAVLAQRGSRQACVNAGGDLRLFGPATEPVALAVDDAANQPVMFIANGAIASSCGAMTTPDRRDPGAHVAACGASQPHRFVSVTAATCMDADALTKVVMALGAKARPILAAWHAAAVLYQAGCGWHEIAGAQ